MMKAIQGSDTIGAEVLTSVVNEFRDAINGTGTPLGDAGTIPDLVRVHVINRTRWLWLCEFPSLKIFQTEARSKLNDAAQQMLTDITTRKQPVNGPDAVTSPVGNWNSENKIVMRMHPVPRPGTQATPSSGYANPEGEEDQSA